jgi:hypothetical protein
MADDGRQYEATPYDLGLTDNAELSWPAWREAEGVPAAAAPCMVPSQDREAEAEL